MRVDFPFAGEILAFDIPDDRLVASWSGPRGLPAVDPGRAVARALEAPIDYPPLRRAIVPGDRVAIAWDSRIPEPIAVLSEIVAILGSAGVGPDSIRLITPPAGAIPLGSERPNGVALTIHDPADVASTAYLATTTGGRRIYLNRHLIDADVVIAVGRLGHEPGSGFRGPWSALYPALGNAEAVAAASPALEELGEVGWLLGSPFEIGILEGVSGISEVVAGLEATVRAAGVKRVEESWTFRVDRRAGLVVAGFGPEAEIEELSVGVDSARRLVRRGGKVVLLSRVPGPVGRSLRRILNLDDPRSAPAKLRGFEGEPDFAAARRIAEALAWSDVYLLSGLGDEADDLVTAALQRPEEARRLIASADSVILLGAAEKTIVELAEGED